ncbi:hypothetical protein AVEN_76641-1 [Araneus ventricosus]|uniref:DUF7041 domain-containing protein n=1 Tax=Araneus ventricosus TaxID=182803 RepID=A0A4Y2RFQ4_ARAVE|nr:hypothetical protein AVEN_76641-1 [Araneus ventricosus]
MPDGPETTKPELARVAFLAPPFWETDPDLWFLQLESQCKLSGISIDETKFHTNLQLGDKKPPRLLEEMRNLAAVKVSEGVLRTIWMQRLPTSIQQILSVSNDNLDVLSLIADKVNEVSRFDAVVNSVASDNSVIQSFRDEISEFRAELMRISCPRFRQSSRGRQENSRVRSVSNSRKLKGSSVLAAADRSHTHSRLFLHDRSTGFRFLIDSGVDVSCFPRRLTNYRVAQDNTLYAANGSAIKCYGTKTLNLDLGLRRKFSWSFIVSDISHPIIGSDFLERFELLIDIKNRRLIDGLTFLSAKGVKAPGNTEQNADSYPRTRDHTGH